VLEPGLAGRERRDGVAQESESLVALVGQRRRVQRHPDPARRAPRPRQGELLGGQAQRLVALAERGERGRRVGAESRRAGRAGAPAALGQLTGGADLVDAGAQVALGQRQPTARDEQLLDQRALGAGARVGGQYGARLVEAAAVDEGVGEERRRYREPFLPAVLARAQERRAGLGLGGLERALPVGDSDLSDDATTNAAVDARRRASSRASTRNSSARAKRSAAINTKTA